MARDVRHGGDNARPLDDTIAETGPGIADDALAPAETPSEPVDDAAVERVKAALESIGE